MLIKQRKSWEISENEVTPQGLYLSRRNFIKGMGAAGALALLAACRPPREAAVPTAQATQAAGSGTIATPEPATPTTDELGDPLNSFDDITGYNNYYEFTTDKRQVQELAKDFVTNPWQVEVKGMVRNPGVYDIDTLRNRFDQEERIYRLRCVEAWSMVIPWLGFPIGRLLDVVEPTSSAKYVKFQTLYDPEQFPGQRAIFNPYEWPYTEGLRLDEAYHDLAIFATGIYGEYLLPQNGAPFRVVVPWKYGFKSVKSIVSIELTDQPPTSLWMAAAPNEYGFYANVNPNVNHPRWSQATERRIGESGRRETLMFNGYEEQVADLYAGMDLRANF